MAKKDKIEDIVGEDVESGDTIIVEGEPETKKVPTKADPEWTQYVLGHLTPDELCYGNPRMHGLRRLVYLLEGNIIEQHEDRQTIINPDVLMSVNTYSVVICGHDGVSRSAVGTGDAYVLLKGDAGEVQYNVQNPKFGKFVSAMAETRAKSRCYINALAIQCNASEEFVDGVAADDISSEKMSPIQLSILETIAEEQDINISKFVALVKKNKQLKFDRISNILERDAKVILGEIQQYRNGVKVPQTLQGYDRNWRGK